MSSFLLTEGLHGMGSMGVSLTQFDLRGLPQEDSRSVFPPLPAPLGAVEVAQGFMVRPPPLPATNLPRGTARIKGGGRAFKAQAQDTQVPTLTCTPAVALMNSISQYPWGPAGPSRTEALPAP